MGLYRRGSRGAEVAQIQTRLRTLGFLDGAVDSTFGGNTEEAVKLFQSVNSLPPSGSVDANTWAALFPENPKVPDPPIFGKPLNYRCLALTGSFETSTIFPDCFAGITGDFDRMGLSFGALQWNLGRETLQKLMSRMNGDHAGVLQNIFADRYPTLLDVLGQSIEGQLSWARSIQNSRFELGEPWKTCFDSLGRTEEFQAIQLASAADYFARALDMAKAYGLFSERAAALMFDIAVQNGSISGVAKQQILNDFATLDATLSTTDLEVAKMRIVANRRADASGSAAEDVRSRKLTIANGTGTVHGDFFDLSGQFNLTLRPATPR